MDGILLDQHGRNEDIFERGTEILWVENWIMDSKICLICTDYIYKSSELKYFFHNDFFSFLLNGKKKP